MIDIPHASDEELLSEIAGAQEYLNALLAGAGLEGRESAKMQEMRNYIAACQAELEKRNAPRS